MPEYLWPTSAYPRGSFLKDHSSCKAVFLRWQNRSARGHRPRPSHTSSPPVKRPSKEVSQASCRNRVRPLNPPAEFPCGSPRLLVQHPAADSDQQPKTAHAVHGRPSILDPPATHAEETFGPEQPLSDLTAALRYHPTQVGRFHMPGFYQSPFPYSVSLSGQYGP